MTKLAYINTNNVKEAIELPRLVVSNEKVASAPSQTVLMLGAILMVLQILDGILTGIGMSLFGTSAEGNTFLRFLMEHMGYVPALVVCKSFAVAVVAFIVSFSRHISWVNYALSGMIAIYTCLAIIPWTYILAPQLF